MAKAADLKGMIEASLRGARAQSAERSRSPTPNLAAPPVALQQLYQQQHQHQQQAVYELLSADTTPLEATGSGKVLRISNGHSAPPTAGGERASCSVGAAAEDARRPVSAEPAAAPPSARLRGAPPSPSKRVWRPL